MTAICENVGSFIALLSVRFHILSMFVSGKTALIIAVAFVGLISAIYSEAIFILMAVSASIGAVLPAVSVQNFATHCAKYPSKTYHWSELTIVLVLYVMLLSASLRVFLLTLTGLDICPQPVARQRDSVFMLACALWRQHFFVAGTAVFGQIAWIFDVGSTNYLFM